MRVPLVIIVARECSGFLRAPEVRFSRGRALEAVLLDRGSSGRTHGSESDFRRIYFARTVIQDHESS